LDEIELLGFPLRSPFDLVKEPIPAGLTAPELSAHSGKVVEMAGYLVTTKHTRTKYREHMMFGTFIDRQGNFFDTTHFPKVAAGYPLRGRGCYLIKGKVAEEFGFYSLDVISLRLLGNHTRESVTVTST